MTDKKISQLTEANPLVGTEVTPIVQSGSTVKTTVQDIANLLKTGTLAQFASTTSAQLAGVISDETGTGKLVFATQPQFTTGMSLDVAPYSWFSTFKAYDQPAYSVASQGTTGVFQTQNAYFNTSVQWIYKDSYGAQRYDMNHTDGHTWYSAPAGTAGNVITWTQTANLSAAGNMTLNVGNLVIGTSGKGITTGSAIPLGLGTNNGVSSATIHNSGGVSIGNTTDPGATNLSVSGIGLVGTTSTHVINGYTGQLTVASPGTYGVMCYQSVAGGYCFSTDAADNGGVYYQMVFNSAGTGVGSITSSTSATNYGTSSDIRLKEDKGLSTDASAIDKTEIHDFVWKRDGSISKGVFAQDAIKVKPEAVTRGMNEDLDADGYPINPWGVDYSKYVPDLILYCQQLKQTISDLEAKLKTAGVAGF